jgi:DNA polymerase epsilon subunit 3
MFSVLLYTLSGGKMIGSPQTKEVQEKRNMEESSKKSGGKSTPKKGDTSKKK